MKKTARAWLANSRVDVRLCKHSYFPLLLAICYSTHFSFSQTCTRVFSNTADLTDACSFDKAKFWVRELQRLQKVKYYSSLSILKIISIAAPSTKKRFSKIHENSRTKFIRENLNNYLLIACIEMFRVSI